MDTKGVVILVLILIAVYFYTTRKERFRDNIQPLNYDASMAFHRINFNKDAKGNTDADYYLADKLYKQ